VLDDNLEEDIFFLLIAEMLIAKLPIFVGSSAYSPPPNKVSMNVVVQ
jgi:hypothetical protein